MKRAENAKDALAYMADFTLATVDDYAMKKRPPIGEYRRQRSIAQIAVNWILRFDISPEGTRAKTVIEKHNGSVDEYAAAIEAQYEN